MLRDNLLVKVNNRKIFAKRRRDRAKPIDKGTEGSLRSSSVLLLFNSAWLGFYVLRIMALLCLIPLLTQAFFGFLASFVKPSFAVFLPTPLAKQVAFVL